MICPKCGTELRDGVLMCPICGTKQEVPPPVTLKNMQNNPKIFTKTRVISVITSDLYHYRLMQGVLIQMIVRCGK